MYDIIHVFPRIEFYGIISEKKLYILHKLYLIFTFNI